LPVLFFVCSAAAVPADVTLPALFADHMVLQQKALVPLWGRADAEERVTVSLTDRSGKVVQAVSTITDRKGAWRVTLKPIEAGGPYGLTVRGKNTVTREDILIGEVWVCSGQSNMQWPVSRSSNAEREIAASDHPRIRLFTVTRRVSIEEQSDVKGKWEVCTPSAVPGFSAVGFYFGRELLRHLDVPIGLIHSSWGGTPAEAWTRRAALERHEIARPILERYDRAVAGYPEALKRYEARVKAWKVKAAAARAEGKRPPWRPGKPYGPGHPHSPSGLWGGMIAPLTPFAIRGVIWYQGEANASRAYQYRTLFPVMIKDWRDAWGQGDFPFLFVQLANFEPAKNRPAHATWPELREAQAVALSLPGTGMALAIDIGNPRDIHPRNKQEVGRRLALQACAVAYGEQLVSSGPVFERAKRKDTEVVVWFKNTGGGLMARGEKLEGFEIAGRDRKYHPAVARLSRGPALRQVVVLSSPRVPEPLHVRYAWADNPRCNLYNQEGLPAAPFRTDDWPGVTVDRR